MIQPEVLALVDAGLIPFAQCNRCARLMPHSMEDVFGKTMVYCGRCRTPVAKSVLLMFLSPQDTRQHGFDIQETTAPKPPN